MEINSAFMGTSKFKLYASFIARIALMIAIGQSGLFGAGRISRNSEEARSSVTAPIVQLSKRQALQLKVRVALGRMQTLRSDTGVRQSLPSLLGAALERDAAVYAEQSPRFAGDGDTSLTSRNNSVGSN